MKKSKTIIFDGLESIIHFFIGFLLPYIPILNIIILFLYVIYQVTEKENKIKKLGDFIELIIGYIAGVLVLKTLLLILLKSGFFG